MTNQKQSNKVVEFKVINTENEAIAKMALEAVKDQVSLETLVATNNHEVELKQLDKEQEIELKRLELEQTKAEVEQTKAELDNDLEKQKINHAAIEVELNNELQEKLAVIKQAKEEFRLNIQYRHESEKLQAEHRTKRLNAVLDAVKSITIATIVGAVALEVVQSNERIEMKRAEYGEN